MANSMSAALVQAPVVGASIVSASENGRAITLPKNGTHLDLSGDWLFRFFARTLRFIGGIALAAFGSV